MSAPNESRDWEESLDSYSDSERAGHREHAANAEADLIACAEVELATLREEYLERRLVLNKHRMRVLPDEFTVRFFLVED
jgi:hypothetical protein